MSSIPNRPMNRITIIATLGTQREWHFNGKERRANEVEIRSKHLRGGSVLDTMVLQMESPWGVPYALSLDANRSVIGGELLTNDPHDTRRRLKFEGRLMMHRREDRRFADNPLADGRMTRDLHVMVERVSLPTEDEQDVYGARVELDAQIVMPCRYPRNHEIGVRMITTVVQVSGLRTNSLIQGSYHQASDSFNRVLIAVPDMHPNASYLLRQGNRLHLTGDLEVVYETIGGAQVQAKLQDIDTAWERQIQAAMERKVTETEIRRLWNRYRSERLRSAEHMRLRVAVLGLEPAADAEPGTVEENREWYYEVRKMRRAARQAQELRRHSAEARVTALLRDTPPLMGGNEADLPSPVPEAVPQTSDVKRSIPQRHPIAAQHPDECRTMVDAAEEISAAQESPDDTGAVPIVPLADPAPPDRIVSTNDS